MLLLGIDLGTSSVKVSVLNSTTGKLLASATYPETEREIKCVHPGWAEQSPDQWWSDVQAAILKAHSSKTYDPNEIRAIGIAYQMHGLVLTDKEGKLLRDSIIWSDSRAVEIGRDAFAAIGKDKCLTHLLNSPGNFTASKLAWVKQNEPKLYDRIDKAMLPGDYISLKMTGQLTSSISGLSEGIFWDFLRHELSKDIFKYFGFDPGFIGPVKDVFSEHGRLTKSVAETLSLRPKIPVSYKAGDQPNNALALRVIHPGEVAATAGTSGVVYAVSDRLKFDRLSRVNSFAHVNFTDREKRIGILLNINGAGILNNWIRSLTREPTSYEAMNDAASKIPPGSNGLTVIPFGNGAERMMDNNILNAHLLNIDFNRHGHAHLYRAAQEGIAFAFRYGMEIMKQDGIHPTVIRAGNANMFQSPIFREAFVNSTGIPLELYATDGSKGAAIGAGLGAGIFSGYDEAFYHAELTEKLQPDQTVRYNDLYENWMNQLFKLVNK